MATTSVTGEREQLAAQELRLKTSQFTRYMWAVAILGGIFAVLDIAAVLAGGSQQFYALAVQASALCIIAVIAVQLVHTGRWATGVQFWSLTSSVYLMTVPILATGLLPFVVIGAVINTVTVAVFLSPRWLQRVMLPLAILVGVATALERWAPWPRIDEMSNTPLIPIALNLTSAVFAAFLINLLGETLLRALGSSQEYAGQLEQSRTALMKQTTELEQSAASLAQRSEELEKTNRNWQITSQQAERRATQLAASAQVARAVSQVRDLDQLLPQVTHLISQAFGCYHVGVFIVDETRRFAVLRAANSEGGQRLMARGYKLAVGKEGIVGRVASLGQPRIALDTGADADYLAISELPLTHSEIALPLTMGDKVFGVLEVESTQPAAFTEDDLAIMGALADQIAIAIENVRLFAQTQSALQEAEETQKRYQRQDWERLLPTLSSTRHEYHASGVPSVGDAALPEIEQAIQRSDVVTMTSQATARSALAVPIKLRDQVIGVIDLHETESEREWTADDVALVMAVADQAGLALENARLLEQTQQRARREQLVTQIATKVRAAADVEGILRTGVQEIRRVLGASHGIVHLRTESLTPTPDAASRPGNSEVVT